MAEIALTGCPATRLSGYLSALGIHRAVARVLDDAAEGRWEHGTYRLICRFATVEELAAALNAQFEPESIVSPWNSGAGFAATGTRPTADRNVAWVRASTDQRLEQLRLAVAGGDRVVSECQRRGIDPWDKRLKAQVMQLCRNEFPDSAVAWLDAAAALGQASGPSYSRLLGTGGNFGSQELSATYLQQVRTILDSPKSLNWLASALDGYQREPLPKDSPGQFDPGGVGASDESNPVANPWTFLLLVEGTLLFATAVVRRYGSAYQGAALPFQTPGGAAAGFASSAAGEPALAELWTPQWSEPMRIPDIAHLLGEGRADWNSNTARSGLDMARAAATLGIDRGITAFQRHVFVNRLGQNPIAVPAGRIQVGARGGVDLLAGLDSWRAALRRSDPPSYTAARLRNLDQTLYAHACSGEPSAFVEVFTALGRCRWAASRSGKVRHADLPRLSLPDGAKLLDLFRGALSEDRELRIALAIATSGDEYRPVRTWLTDPLFASGFAQGLADIARRRSFPLATAEAVGDRTLAVRGARIAFARGMRLQRGDIHALVQGGIDDDRTAALVLGLVCIDWRYTPSETLPGDYGPPDPALDLLLLYTGVKPLDYTNLDGTAGSLFVRPGHEWPAQLIAGHTREVIRDASRRLRIAGLRKVVTVPDAPYNGTRLAAALFVNTHLSDRRTALSRLAVIAPHPTPSIQEAPA